jgi:hypothetical protein
VRICFLILAHNNVQHFERLLSALTAEDSGIFVHIDKRADSRPFAEIVLRYGGAFAENRVQINWGGWSMVQATLNLMQCAAKSGQKFDYFCLISGSDFPLRPLPTLLSFFATDPRVDYINSVPMPSAEANKPISRVSKFHFEVASSRGRFQIHQRAKAKFNSLIQASPICRDYEKALQVRPHAGSQWWALTETSVRYILNFAEKDPAFVRFFRNTYIPDEAFFQTVLATASRSSTRKRNLTYTDWSRPNPPYPAILDLDHIEFLIQSRSIFEDSYGRGPVFFARKFPNDSKELVDRVKNTLWNDPIPPIVSN